jgi:hypothetical protein
MVQDIHRENQATANPEKLYCPNRASSAVVWLTGGYRTVGAGTDTSFLAQVL